MPAEKFLRAMFGFNKANTPGLLNGPLGAATTMGGFQALSRWISGKSNKGNDNHDDSNDKSENKIRGVDKEYTLENLLKTTRTDINNSDDNKNDIDFNNENLDRQSSNINNNDAESQRQRRSNWYSQNRLKAFI